MIFVFIAVLLFMKEEEERKKKQQHCHHHSKREIYHTKKIATYSLNHLFTSLSIPDGMTIFRADIALSKISIESNKCVVPPNFYKICTKQNAHTVCWFVQCNFFSFRFFLLVFHQPNSGLSLTLHVESEFFFLLQWNSIA